MILALNFRNLGIRWSKDSCLSLYIEARSDFIEGDKEESEILINKNTGEELSIVKKRMRYSNYYSIKIIKRGTQKKN